MINTILLTLIAIGVVALLCRACWVGGVDWGATLADAAFRERIPEIQRDAVHDAKIAAGYDRWSEQCFEAYEKLIADRKTALEDYNRNRH